MLADANLLRAADGPHKATAEGLPYDITPRGLAFRHWVSPKV